MIFGARVSLLVATVVLVAGAALGTVVGLASGYIGGLVDEALMRLVDFVFALPFIVVALVASVVWGPSLELVIILLALFTWAPFARQVRAETLQLKTTDYVALARVAGGVGTANSTQTYPAGGGKHGHGVVVAAGRLPDPHGVRTQLPWRRHSTSTAIVGQHGI